MFKIVAVLAAIIAAMIVMSVPALADTVNNTGPSSSGGNVENSHHHEFSNCNGLLACVDLLDF